MCEGQEVEVFLEDVKNFLRFREEFSQLERHKDRNKNQKCAK